MPVSRTDVASGCNGKRVFSTFSLAARTAKRLRRADDESHVEPYHCTHCNEFHIGDSQSRRRDARRDQRDQEQPT